MSDNDNDDNIIAFPSLNEKRYVLGCPECDQAHWTVILTEDQVRFVADTGNELPEGVVLEPPALPVHSVECQNCGFTIGLLDTAVSVMH
jgi:Zn ribbon nucleic-acid-binding protein